jgi:hypothetical protein
MTENLVFEKASAIRHRTRALEILLPKFLGVLWRTKQSASTPPDPTDQRIGMGDLTVHIDTSLRLEGVPLVILTAFMLMSGHFAMSGKRYFPFTLLIRCSATRKSSNIGEEDAQFCRGSAVNGRTDFAPNLTSPVPRPRLYVRIRPDEQCLHCGCLPA